jgi:hypothetical protein
VQEKVAEILEERPERIKERKCRDIGLGTGIWRRVMTKDNRPIGQ